MSSSVSPSPDRTEEGRWQVAERLNARQPSRISLTALTELVAQKYKAPIAVLSLLGETRQYFKAAVGVELTAVPLEETFCRYTIQSDDVMIVPDARLDARFESHALVTGRPNVRFYAGAPVVLDGLRVGTLCILDTCPRTFSSTEAEQLAYSAYIAAAVLGRQSPGSIRPSDLLSFEQWRASVSTEAPCAEQN